MIFQTFTGAQSHMLRSSLPALMLNAIAIATTTPTPALIVLFARRWPHLRLLREPTSFPYFNLSVATGTSSCSCGNGGWDGGLAYSYWGGARGLRVQAAKASLQSTKEGELDPRAAEGLVGSEESSGSHGVGKQLLQLTAPLHSYILAHTPEHEVLRELRRETFEKWSSQMQVVPEQGQLLAMLVKILGATHCIEVGVYTGYSSLAVALALPESGRLVVCDRDSRSLEVARKFYLRAGVNHKVDVRCGLAVDILTDLQKQGGIGRYDFAFIDADKRMYSQYYELTLELIRPGGLLVFDNVLWRGKVADSQVKDKKTTSMRDFNKFLLTDSRVHVCLDYETTSTQKYSLHQYTLSFQIPVGDGMMICRKV
ncbi:hypothetical protein O6H91_12G048700 [Diphasiastrum complanatum]|uniref:Uncharacterized protein n=1 Tax=Diphasiastrum complanatum TaxID=34168 RepID=A0ACC2C1C9_DIPCM|nr:hypothetical protein O6H91_12G048700 [Diphasiastrum complanatum]